MRHASLSRISFYLAILLSVSIVQPVHAQNQIQENNKEALKKRLQSHTEEVLIQQKKSQRLDTVKQNFSLIRDNKKKIHAEKIATKAATINEQRKQRMTNTLDAITAILRRVTAKKDIAARNGAD